MVTIWDSLPSRVIVQAGVRFAGGTPPAERAKALGFERVFDGSEETGECAATAYLKGLMIEASSDTDYPKTAIERINGNPRSR
jgi:hypothetical protein